MTQQETNRTVQQVLDQLLAEGKQTGKLASSHMLDALDAIDAKPEELEHFYDALESAGVEITVDDILDSFQPEEERRAEPERAHHFRSSFRSGRRRRARRREPGRESVSGER